MTTRFKIGLITCLFILTELTAHSQAMPPACAGSKVRYGTTGLPGSTFQWSILPGTGTIIADYGDSIDVEWGLNPGTYSVTVIEHTSLGCTASPAIASVNVVAPPILNLGGNKDLCEGQTIKLTADTGFISYSWDNGSASNSIVTGVPGYHWVTAVSQIGCILRDTVFLTFRSNPQVKITSSDVVINDNKIFSLCRDSVALTVDNISDLTQILWDSITKANIYYAKFPNQKVTVIGTNEYGCNSYDTVSVVVCNYKVDLNIPEAFTPSNTVNGKDIYWDLGDVARRYPNATVQVFDRWGRLVYKSSDASQKWNGIYNGYLLPMDSYYYIIDLKNGTPPITGNVAIIR